jgi:hypothetical protein
VKSCGRTRKESSTAAGVPSKAGPEALPVISLFD